MRSLCTLIVSLYFSCIASIAWASDIVFLGDDARTDVLRKCGVDCKSSSLTFGAPGRNSSASEVANIARFARHAVILVDTASGPLQVTREHILIARQAGVPSLSIMFVNLHMLEGMSNAKELLELEEREVRELMNKYEMGGDRAMVFHDTSIKSIPKLYTNGVGLRSALNTIQSFPMRKSVSLEAFHGQRFSAYLYLLTKLESRSVVSLKEGSVVGLWINGQSVPTVVKSSKTLSPGGNDELLFEAKAPIDASIGSRLLLELGGRIIAAGVLSRGG